MTRLEGAFKVLSFSFTAFFSILRKCFKKQIYRLFYTNGVLATHFSEMKNKGVSKSQNNKYIRGNK